MDDLDFVKAQLARHRTRKDLACAALGVIFDAAALNPRRRPRSPSR
jgi:hypothetical protein